MIYEQCALISAGVIAPDLTGRRIYTQARASDGKEKKNIKNKGNISPVSRRAKRVASAAGSV